MADEAEAAFQEAWGEDANHADVPEELLDGGSFLDNCLAASTPDSARKIMVKWRGQNVSINTAADQKTIAVPNKASVSRALNLQKVNGNVVITREHYQRIVDLNKNIHLTLQCKLYLEQLERGERTNAILRGALDTSGVGLTSVLGINMADLQTQATAENRSMSSMAMARVMTSDQSLRTNQAIDNSNPQYKNILLVTQLTARANKDDPEAGEKAMAGMVNLLGSTAPVVESCADDNFFVDADFTQLLRYKQRMLKDFKADNVELVRYKLRKIADRATELASSNGAATSGPGLTFAAIDNLLSEELASLTDHGGVLDGPSRDLDSARGPRPNIPTPTPADEIPGHGTTRGQNNDAFKLQQEFAGAHLNPFNTGSAKSQPGSSVVDDVVDFTDGQPSNTRQSSHVTCEDVAIAELLEALDELHMLCIKNDIRHTATPMQAFKALHMTSGSASEAMMLIYIVETLHVGTLKQAHEIMWGMDGEICRVDKVAACLEYVKPECELFMCIAFVHAADPSISVDRIHTILKKMALEAAKPRLLKRSISDYSNMPELRVRTGCENYDHLQAALRAHPGDIDAADFFVRVCMAGKKKNYNAVEIAIRTFDDLDKATKLQNQTYEFLSLMAILTEHLKLPPAEPLGRVKVTLTVR